MWQDVKDGGASAWKQPFAVTALFLYRFAWGFALFALVKSVVEPLMYRFPNESTDPGQFRLFLAESQFRLLKTDIVMPYVWLLLALLAARMLLTPLLNAGLYYSIAHTRLNPGYRFFKGIRELARPFFLYYLLQTALIGIPGYLVLLPALRRVWSAGSSYEGILLNALPWIGGTLAYCFLVKLLIMYLQFGRLSERSPLAALGVFLRAFVPVLLISLTLLAAGWLASLVVLTASYLWAGFWALVLYQLFRFAETFLDVWAVTSQHSLYVRKTG
ncbi:hypothetical protein J31TS4_35930 [Paenibacillus sp. J31TS4]|nr:hypothetical protein J31TS4_35930 [Paenibacillus sp. J31TS4]